MGALISIIVPIYNTELYLKECLDSIIGQSYHNLEIILVDDGSTDSSAIICDEYAKRDERFKVIHQKNGGRSVARNTGLDNVTGAYTAFVDSDDMVHPEFVDVLYKLIIDYNLAISSCNFHAFYESSHIPIETAIGNIEYFGVDYIDLLREDRLNIQSVILCNKLFHSSVFQSLRFPVGLIHEDDYIFTDLYDRKYERKVAYTDQKLYYYRQNVQGSITNTPQFSEERFYAKEEIFKRRIRFFHNDKANLIDAEWQLAFLYYSSLKEGKNILHIKKAFRRNLKYCFILLRSNLFVSTKSKINFIKKVFL